MEYFKELEMLSNKPYGLIPNREPWTDGLIPHTNASDRALAEYRKISKWEVGIGALLYCKKCDTILRDWPGTHYELCTGSVYTKEIIWPSGF